ncbi:MAG: hypothetical protein SFV55_17545 [Haliscomenobacter sp.]|uniref:hypothetical protein n=1 Tax=Haliscomenobacter sp. TaxID=2717303 RepID=UPI0029B68498|nr:hypothetical protein [Haliscomenobacter sp.]MDX2070236.1 hypothetical protein [Haliscomenobacter sp.]
MDVKPPIINCHSHVFTGDHVPPYLAKTFVPWPFYYFLPLSLVVSLFRMWYNHINEWKHKAWWVKIHQILFRLKILGDRNLLAKGLIFLFGLMITIHAFFILYDGFVLIIKPQANYNDIVNALRKWLLDYNLLYIPKSLLLKSLLVLIVFIFFKLGRNFIFFILKKIWAFLGILPGSDSKALAKRYLNIGRYAFYKEQYKVFNRLKKQYPTGAGFVLLPMDMEFMGAGSLKEANNYAAQMEGLLRIKKNHKDSVFPFVFIDPRRLKKEEAKHFDYEVQNGKVILKDCFIKEYIEKHGFSGFKIYPSLGYYPFDEVLLPLWKYAADNDLPILTHCIRGTIFYRGKKEKQWDKHPVFKQCPSKGIEEALDLLEIKNKDFVNNFTHPLNYLCLLDERFLRQLIAKSKDKRIHDLFGYQEDEPNLKQNLRELKLCFGHYGGDDEWKRFMEQDRGNYGHQMIQYPSKGIDFSAEEEKHEDDEALEKRQDKLAQIWRSADWYSIISSLMLQFPNVYADLSYILYNPQIQPLLKQTLLNPGLKSRVLFGTDFYVVRNHLSDKNILADLMDQLSESEFDQIARFNPSAFLNNTVWSNR